MEVACIAVFCSSRQPLQDKSTMNITSSDIINLSHALKDVCEVDCGTSPCLTQTLRTVLQYNLIMANLQYGKKLCESESPQGRPVIPYDKIVQSPFKKEAPGDSSL